MQSLELVMGKIQNVIPSDNVVQQSYRQMILCKLEIHVKTVPDELRISGKTNYYNLHFIDVDSPCLKSYFEVSYIYYKGKINFKYIIM